ncbi:replication initiation protein RepC [Rhizobium aquaticum]|uniref:Replication initiation protein RepC n=1 Tax=Rhizobium aquaticum TaxID=1549636 RepID=A0ABV2J0N4_9HYPH
MNEEIATTPFGGGCVDARQILRRKQVLKEQTERAAHGARAADGRIDKWRVLRDLTEAKTVYDLSDRAIAVLEALLSFHPERQLDGSKPLIVFPSNQQLSLRTRGMSPATIRRHLAALVAAGLIFRRDSPNGKRYCRRDQHGAPQDMFGFDLAPLALAAETIARGAETVRAEARARQALRAEVTLHLRDIAKLLQAAINEGRAGGWDGYEARLQALSGRVARNASFAALRERKNALLKLRAEVETAYLDAVSSSLPDEEMSTCVHQFEHHIQNPESDQIHESACDDVEGDYPANNHVSQDAQDETDTPPSKRSNHQDLSLPRILKACPQIADYSRNGIRNWADFMGAIALVRAMLRISPACWNTACAAMGEGQAAFAVAAILERAEHIRSPGSYLRALAQKAGAGRSVGLAMMQALERQGDRQHGHSTGSTHRVV